MVSLTALRGRLSAASPNKMKKEAIKESAGRVFRRIRGYIFYLDYYRLHVIYFVVVTILTALIVIAIEDYSFIDSWFTTASAMTVTGLSVTDFARTSSYTKGIVWCLMWMGGQVTFATTPLLLRQLFYAWRERTVKRGWRDLFCPCLWVSTPHAARDVAEKKEQYALLILSFVYLSFGLLISCISIVVLGIYCSQADDVVMKLNAREVNGWGFAAFHTISALNNCGLTLLSDSLVIFQNDAFILLWTCVLIASGNTLLPIFIRWILLFLKWTCRGKKERVEILSLILHQPRAYTTHVFSSLETSWLLFIWILITLFQFVYYTAAPYNVSLERKPLDMFFTTITTRTAGFNVINLSILNAGILVLQVLFMYLASYPFIVAIKSTTKLKRVKKLSDLEQESVLQYSGNVIEHETAGFSIRGEMKRVLSNDLLWLAFGTWAIAAFDKSITLESLYRLIFEVTSAYGNVGLSLSRQTDIASFSGSFNVFGKFVLICIMIGGRHRVMPHRLDSAVAEIAPGSRTKKPRPVFKLDPDQNYHTVAHLPKSRVKRSLSSLFR